MSESEVLKPGGFWICPDCGQRNKVWAPCSSCGAALAGMKVEAMPAPAAAPLAEAAERPWRSRLFYTMAGAGLLVAIAVAALLARVLGGAALDDEASPEPSVRADAAPTPAPEAIPSTPPRAFEERLPPTPPAAIYTPSTPAQPPAWSIPAPSGARTAVGDPRASLDVRARQQAVRAAQARFARAEAALAAAGASAETDSAAMRELEAAARQLREAETALDRARRRFR